MRTNTSPETPAERVAHVVLDYYRQAEAITGTITDLERTAWYATLTQTVQDELHQLLPALWNGLPAFTRYRLETRGFSMLRYVRAHLSPSELTHWVDDGAGSVQAT